MKTCAFKPYILSILLLFCLSAHAQQLFQPALDCCNDLPLATGDFNGDGKLDLIVGSTGGFTIMLGNGAGTFQQAAVVTHNFVSIVAGDFNGDGKLDIATGQSAKATVFLGNGDGSFQTGVDYVLSQNLFVSWTLRVADFNGDGIPDIAAAVIGSPITSTISVIIGHGDGTFGSAVESPAGFIPGFLVTGDFNHDGKVDIVASAADHGVPYVNVLLGNGNGTFQAPVQYVASVNDAGIVSGDLNGDGNLDLVVTDSVNSDRSITVLLGNADGSFQPGVKYAAPSPTSGQIWNSLAIADFNGDGKLDLAFGGVAFDSGACQCASNYNDYVILGNGDGTFQNAVNVVLGYAAASIVVADFNGDGRQDLAVEVGRTSASAPTASITKILINTAEASTTAALVSSDDAEFYAVPVTLTATVSPSVAGTPTGTVTFVSLLFNSSLGRGLPEPPSSTLGTVAISGGAAQLILPGTFVPGTHLITAIYSGDANYSGSSSRTLLQVINRSDPVITWPQPSPISYGTPLSAAQLNATANVPGAFIYNQRIGTVLKGGMHSLKLGFQPDDHNFNFVEASVDLLVTPLATTTTLISTINPDTINSPVTLTYTATLLASNVDTPTGTITFKDGATVLDTVTLSISRIAQLTIPSGVIPAFFAGTHSITATYSGDGNFSGSVSTVLSQVVKKADPAIAWNPPAAITYGTPLSAAQLNATASVPGAFVYTPAAGAVLSAGPQMLSLSFTPTDTTNYNPATATVTLNVNKLKSVITWNTPAAIPYGMPLSTTQLNAAASVPGEFFYTYAIGAVLNAGAQTISVIFVPADSASYDFATASVTLQVLPPPSATPDYAISANPSSVTLKAGQSATIQITVTPQNGFTSSVSLSCGTVPQFVTCTFSPGSLTPSGAPVTGVLIVQTAGPNAVLRAPVNFDGHAPLYGWMSLSSIGIAGLVLAGSAKQSRRKRISRTAVSYLLGLLILVLVVAAAGCGGTAAIATQPVQMTPQGSSSVAVSASSGTGAASMSHQLNLTINVVP